MPKYLIQASYTAEGLKGLQKDKASGRRTAVASAIETLGGKLEATYYTFGQDDVIVIVDLPDNTAASSLSLAVSASGLVRTKTTLFSPLRKWIRLSRRTSTIALRAGKPTPPRTRRSFAVSPGCLARLGLFMEN